MAATAETAVRRGPGRPRKEEAPKAQQNGTKEVSTEELETRMDLLAAMMEERFAGMETMLEEHFTAPKEETKPQELRQAVREGLEDEAKDVRSRARRSVKRTADSMIPRSKQDLLHLSQGLVIGFIGGRRMGPLPFLGW